MDNKPGLMAYLASGWTVLFGGLTLEKFAVMVGISTAIATFFINWYYKAKEDKRDSKRLFKE